MKKEMLFEYASPRITLITIYTEGVLCQSDSDIYFDHDGFFEDDEDLEDLW